MRTYPTGWPADSADQTLPDVYLHVIGSAWPPADGDMPAGYAKVGDWETARDFVGSLLPSQVRGGTGVATSTGKSEIPQPPGGTLAPWRTGAERIPGAGECELLASYDGPTGSTVFLIGRFLLDPITGKASEPFLTLELVENLAKLRKPHNLRMGFGPGAGFGAPFSPTQLITASATELGLTVDVNADFPAQLTSSYVPGKTDTLTAWQQVAAANLGAISMSPDGSTVILRDADYMSGGGPVVETIDVLDKLEDLEWKLDPADLVDRIELQYQAPVYDDDDPAVWTAPKGMSIDGNQNFRLKYDPGRATFAGTGQTITVNTNPSGSGSGTVLDADFDDFYSGTVEVSVFNNTSVRYWFVDTAGHATGINGGGSRIDRSSDETKPTLTWGVAAEDAINLLTVDLGRHVQRQVDAQAILTRIVNRLSTPMYQFEDVRIATDLRRELGDTVILTFPDADLYVKAITTKLSLSGTKGSIVQTASYAVVPFTIADFNSAWNAGHPGATIADFNTYWNAHLPGATIADFNEDPLAN